MRPYLLIVFLFLVACHGEDTPVINSPRKLVVPDQESWDSSYEISVEGVRRALVWSGRTRVFNRQQKADLSDSIHVDFFDQAGIHQSVLIADSGIFFQRSNDIKVWKNVVVVSDSGFVLKTALLNWDNRRQKIYTDSSVIFYSDDDTLFGDGFESDASLENYEISNPRGSGLVHPGEIK